jgi:hypothetical protein
LSLYLHFVVIFVFVFVYVFVFVCVFVIGCLLELQFVCLFGTVFVFFFLRSQIDQLFVSSCEILRCLENRNSKKKKKIV